MIPKSKNELLHEIDTSFEKLLLKISKIPKEKYEVKEMLWHKKNTYMSPKNLISYLLWWGELVFKWLEYDRVWKIIIFPIEWYNWNQLWELAQKFYTDHEDVEFELVVWKLKKIKENIIEYINQNSNTILYETPWYKEYTRWRMIQLNTSSPYKNASARIQQYLKSH